MHKLKKELNFLGLFCVATGAMISSGLFILPGLAFAQAGPAVIISYLIAGLFCLPTLFSMAELTTAMPKAGGDYFYIMRGFGPLLGTMAGFSTWFSLSLKGAFALIGMGAYLSVISTLPLTSIALACCFFFILLNLVGVKEAVALQVLLVLGLLLSLIIYIVWGIKVVQPQSFSPFFSNGIGSVFATASFVFISYGGLTKVAALAEEVKDPGRNLPQAMFASLVVTSILYALVIYVTVGVLRPEALKATLMPISDGAFIFGGEFFRAIISIGAFLAFVSTANSGLMTASRYPLGMSRDKLLPFIFQKISARFKTPYVAILSTGCFMIMAILFLKLELLVKVASSILILLYIFANATLVLFRESKIESYRPKFRSPFYPYLQVIGIIGGIFLLIEMGAFIVFLTLVFLLLAFMWYRFYARQRAAQDSALIHLLEKLVAKDKDLTSDNLLAELKDIVIVRDDLYKDRFHQLVEEAHVVDIALPVTMESFFNDVSAELARQLHLDSQKLCAQFLEREQASSTVIGKGLAIPHVIVDGKNVFKILFARAKAGIIFPDDKIVHVVFVLIGSADERNLHLKVLAAIAQITQSADFDKKWMGAEKKEDLKDIVLLADRRRG
ncbi:MAG: amino acid permease [Candidatus Omnitrophota bacterium]